MDAVLKQPQVAALLAQYLDHDSLVAWWGVSKATRRLAEAEFSQRCNAVEGLSANFELYLAKNRCPEQKAAGCKEEKEALVRQLSGLQLRLLRAEPAIFSAQNIAAADAAIESSQALCSMPESQLRFSLVVLTQHAEGTAASLRACDLKARRWVNSRPEPVPMPSLSAAQELFCLLFGRRLARERQESEDHRLTCATCLLTVA